MVDEQLLASLILTRVLCLLLFLVLLLFGICIWLRLAGSCSRVAFLIGLLMLLLFGLVGLSIVLVEARSWFAITGSCRRVVEHLFVVRHLMRKHCLKGNLRSLIPGMLCVELLR